MMRLLGFSLFLISLAFVSGCVSYHGIAPAAKEGTYYVCQTKYFLIFAKSHIVRYEVDPKTGKLNYIDVAK